MHWYQLVHGSGSNSNFGGIEYFASVYFSRMEFKSRKSRKIVAREKYPVYSIRVLATRAPKTVLCLRPRCGETGDETIARIFTYIAYSIHAWISIRHVLYCVIEQRYALNRLFISFLQKYFHLSRPSHLYKMHVAMRYVIVVPTLPFHNSAELALN